MLPGRRIAEGRTAEVYLWGETQVLKLFRDWMPAAAAEYEARIARSVAAAGAPVPAVGEVVEVKGPQGIVYERVTGPSLMDLMQADPGTIPHYASLLAELHAALHAQPAVLALPAQRARLAEHIAAAEPLSPAQRAAALEKLAGMPEEGALCHGDFHPGNIIMAERGPVIIDWVDAARGSAAADVARTWVLLMGHTVYPDTPPWVRPFARECSTVHLQRYLALGSIVEDEVMAWVPIVAAARLHENIPEAREWLLSVAERGAP
jgi:Ser/Thr protein kinase RdoA (MazF antagonist)